MTVRQYPQTPAESIGRLTRWLDQTMVRLLKLARPLSDYGVERNVPVPTRDGVRLLTDHYAPIGTSFRGTVLMRGPYGRGLPADLLQARLLAGQGYHVVNQSCRGTFGSGGEFEPFTREYEDAQDTVAWLREQEWFDGRFATYGASYLAWTQWALLTDPPPELRTAVVSFGFHDFADFAWGSGAFALNDMLTWSESIVYQERVRPLPAMVRQATATRRIRPVADKLPLADAADHLLRNAAPWFRSWLQHSSPADPYWHPYRADEALQRVSVPVMLLGGWQDMFLRQTLEQYQVLHDRGVEVGLTVGPWAHVRIGPGDLRAMLGSTLDWLAEHLAGEPARRREAVQIYVGGADAWRHLPVWPAPADELRLYLNQEGHLTRDPVNDSTTSSFRYDPTDPTPSVGGRTLSTDAGVKDNRALEARSDVLTFTTEPQAAPLEIVGVPLIELLHTRDNRHADLFVRLCDVDPKGRSRNFSDGYVRLDPAGRLSEEPIKLALDPCAHLLAPGHRLRLQVAGGAHPYYGRNEGTGATSGTGTLLKTCKHTVHHGGDAPSQLILPTRSGQWPGLSPGT